MLFRMYLVSAIVCSLVVLGHSEITTPKQEIIDIKTTSEVPPPTTEPTTTPTAKPTTPTTTTSSTTTPTPPTTPPTTTSTTTTTTTTSTTAAPPSTSTVPPPPPTPPSPPAKGSWSYEKDNKTCILVQFAAQLNVTYTKAVNQTNEPAHVLLNVPTWAAVSGGSCGNSSQHITLSWPLDNATLTTNNLTLVFQRNDSTHNYALQYLNVSLVNNYFPNSTWTGAVSLSHGADWLTPLATSYRCEQPTSLKMAADAQGMVADMMLSKLQEEAFRTAHGKDFSAARECGGGDLPDAVPIAVGCALGGLVLVVLVAYLAARRRSAARGYVSM